MAIFFTRIVPNEITTDQIAIAFGNDYFGSAIALSVKLIEGIMNLKPNAIGMGMLTVPFTFPQTPMSAGL
jgi:hypothetical protein